MEWVGRSDKSERQGSSRRMSGEMLVRADSVIDGLAILMAANRRSLLRDARKIRQPVPLHLQDLALVPSEISLDLIVDT